MRLEGSEQTYIKEISEENGSIMNTFVYNPFINSLLLYIPSAKETIVFISWLIVINFFLVFTNLSIYLSIYVGVSIIPNLET